MRIWIPGLLVVLGVGMTGSNALPDTYTITVHGRDNTVRDHVTAKIPMPSGMLSFTVSATGSAHHALGQAFSSLIIEYKDHGASVQRALPIGESLEITTTNDGHELNLFFVDGDTSDNSGLVVVTATSSAFGTQSQDVSPVDNCATDHYAAEIILLSSPCEVSATGMAYYGGPGRQYRNVVLMYEDSVPNPNRHFHAVEINGSTTFLPFFSGGRVKLFFADAGPIGDNGGIVDVAFICEGPVAAEIRSWGQIKSIYR